MKKKNIEKNLANLASLREEYAQKKAEAENLKQTCTAVEQELTDWALAEDFRGDRVFENGRIKVSSGKEKLTLTVESETFDSACAKDRKLKLNRFIRTKIELIKNKVKEEMSEEDMRKIGVQIVKEPSVKIEAWTK